MIIMIITYDKNNSNNDKDNNYHEIMTKKINRTVNQTNK